MSIRFAGNLILLLILVLAGISAGPAPQAVAQDPVLIPVKVENARRGLFGKVRPPEFVDVYGERDDWTPIWSPELPIVASFHMGDGVGYSGFTAREDTTQGQPRRRRQTQGFRVQLANVMSEDQARAIESRASALFESIYITFRSPTYKVRAGDFTKRADADRAAEEAKAMGFRGAWVVPDRVYVEE